jgi:uncharacterized protein (DUF427 family)
MGEKNAESVIIDYTKRNHPIRVVRSGKTLTVMAYGEEILKTRNAYILYETGRKPVYYFPISEVRDRKLKATDTVSVCPYKGRAHYYSLLAGKREIKDSAWRYSEPNEDFNPIKDYIAFYDSVIDGIEESE